MKIVDRKAFLSLPENTVFSFTSYTPENLSTDLLSVYIKNENVGNDSFYYHSVPTIAGDDMNEIIDNFQAGVNENKSITIDFYTYDKEDTCDKSQYFAVWGNDDINSLIKRLSECIK